MNLLELENWSEFQKIEITGPYYILLVYSSNLYATYLPVKDHTEQIPRLFSILVTPTRSFRKYSVHIHQTWSPYPTKQYV